MKFEKNLLIGYYLSNLQLTIGYCVNLDCGDSVFSPLDGVFS